MPETKKFYRSVLLLILLNALVKPLWIFGIDRGVQNLSTGDDYGIFYTLYSFSLLFAILPDMGLANYNGSLLARSPVVLRKYWPGMLGFKLILGLAYLLFVGLAGFLAGYQDHMGMLLLIALNHVLVINISFLRSYVNGLHLYKLDSFFSIFDKAVMIVVCLPVVLSPWFQGERLIWGYILGQTIGFLSGDLLLYWVVARRAGIWKPVFRFEKWFPMLKTTLPFALLGLITSFYTRLDAVLLEKLLPDGEHQVDVYAAAYRLTDALQMLPVLLSSFLLPAFASKIKQKELLRPFVEVAWLGLSIVGILLSLTGWFYGEPIMKSLYQDFEPAHAQVLAWLFTAFLPLSLTYVYGTLLTAAHDTRPLIRIALVGFGFNLIFNLVLIPYGKAVGSGLAVLFTHTPLALLQIRECGKRYGHFIRRKALLNLLAWAVLCIALFYFSVELPFFWLWNWLGCGLIAGVLVFILPVFPLKSLLSFQEIPEKA